MRKSLEKNKIYSIRIDIDKSYNTDDSNVKVDAEDINMTMFGYLLGAGNGSHYLNESPIKMEDIIEDKVDWSSIDKVYRFPHLALSRDKLTILKDKYKVRVVRDINIADVCVISSTTLDKLTSYNYYGKLFTKELFMSKLEGGLKDCLNHEALLKLTDLMDTLTDKDNIYINDRYNNWNNSSAFEKSKLVYFTNGDFFQDTNSSGVYYINKENWEQYSLLTDPNKILISDIYVNQVCSEDSIILDWKYYQNIKTMLEATKDDKDVAMTLMANCQIEESKTALGLLFYHYGETMKGTKVWNQVAFRTLRKQFEHYSTSGWNATHTAPFSNLIEKLIDDNALTEESMSHICDLVFKKVIQSGVGFAQDNCVFEMDRVDIRLKPKFKEKMKVENKSLSEVLTEDAGHLPF
jgi:hypothetical protein